MKRILFVCGRNRLRSPTAEQIFANRPGVEVASAGVDRDADVPLSPETIAWADIIVVMEKGHRMKIRRRWQSALVAGASSASTSRIAMRSWNRH